MAGYALYPPRGDKGGPALQFQRMHGEPVLLIGPAGDRAPAGVLRQPAERLHRVLVGVLGVDGFALAELEAAPRDRDGLLLQALEMHLDAVTGDVVERAVAERREIEVAGQLAIHTRQDVEI